MQINEVRTGGVNQDPDGANQDPDGYDRYPGGDDRYPGGDDRDPDPNPTLKKTGSGSILRKKKNPAPNRIYKADDGYGSRSVCFN